MTIAQATYQALPQRPASPAHGSSLSDEQRSLLLEADALDIDDAASQAPVGQDKVLSARIRWINFVLGAAVLLPWNAVITAMPYFLSRLSGSAFQSTFSSYLSTTFTVTGFCFLAHATAISKQSNFSRQIRRALLTLTLLILLLTLSTFISLPAKVFFFLVLLNGVCQSAAGAYLQSAVVATASLFGPSAIQPVMSGQAAVGILVSLVQVLSAAAGLHTGTNDDDEAATRAAFSFFGISTLFLIFSIASHAWLVTLPAYKAVVVPFEAKKGVISLDDGRESLVRSVDFLQSGTFKKGRIIEVAKMNREYNFTVAYVFMVTLSVFPPITSSIRSVHPPSASPFTHPLLFTALHFLTFNIGDFVGRSLPSYSRFQLWSSRRLLYISLLRTLFIPLFLLCNVQRPSSSPSTTPVVGGPIINSDFLFFIIVLIFGVTNGWVGSLVMMAAPSLEHNPRLQNRPEIVDTAATIAQFFLVGGLAVGSITSFAVKGAICGCNPFTT